MFSQEEGKASTKALTPAPREQRMKYFPFGRQCTGDGSMRTVVLGSVTCGFNTQMRRQEGQHSGRRLQVTHHRAAHLSRQTIRTDAVTKTCGRTTARRNNNVMKANSGKVQKRGSESHVISGGLLRHSLETRTRMFRGTRQFSIWNERVLCNSS